MQSDSHSIESFDLRSVPDGFHDDPFPWYRALRERESVFRCPDGSYLLTRYDDCAQVYRSESCSADKKRMFRPLLGDGPLFEHHTTSLVFSDPPYHARVRRLLSEALRPAAVRAMQPVIERLVTRLLDRAQDHGGSVDIIELFAAAIPLEVIGNLLTVPHEDREPLRGWSLKILGALEADLSAEARAQGDAAVSEFSSYLRGLVSRRRREGSTGSTDILSTLIAAHDGGELSESELLHNCIFLLNAGHETTTNLIGNAVLELLQRPQDLRRLLGDPALIRPAIEETLRYQSPNQLGNREVREPLRLSGVSIPAGAQLTLGIGAANRDPERFDDAEVFRIDRHPNPHLAFATGIHSCLGMSLARLEAQIAVLALFRRFPSMQLAGVAPRQKRARFRGLVRLPVALGPPASAPPPEPC